MTDPKEKVLSLAGEFKRFALKGNVVDLAVGVIIGAAFGKIVESLVKHIIMPTVGLILPGEQGYLGWKIVVGGAEIPYGLFLGEVVNFLIVAFCIFLLVRALNRMKRPSSTAAPVSKDCPACAMTIPIKAKRCPHCTTELAGA